MGKYREIVEGVLNRQIDESSEISFSVTVDRDEDSQEVMDVLNNEYAEGNNVWEHIEDEKRGRKKTVVAVYRINQDKSVAKRWAQKVSREIKSDAGWDVDFVVN